MLIFLQYLLFTSVTTGSLAWQRYDVTERNVAQSNAETVDHLNLVVCTMSDR